MKKECPNPHCNYQNTNSCDEGFQDVQKCSYYKPLLDEKTKASIPIEKDQRYLSWTSNAMGLLDIPIISQRSSPKIIGVIGTSDAGKTTFLGTFYNLLHNGYFLEDYTFSGSYTIKGWEYVAHPMRFNNVNESHFPKHTSSNPERIQGLLHLALNKKGHAKDILFTDVSGEWFVNWADNPDKSSSQGAKWIHKQADSFLFFIDCEKLIDSNRGTVKEIILNIAHRLNQNLNDRPVAIVWAKADRINDIRDVFKARLKEELQGIFNVFEEFEVSAIPQSISDVYTHTNIIQTINWALNTQEVRKQTPLDISENTIHNDPFFQLKDRI